MSANIPGILIKRRRLEQGWSQEGLCKGICAVSYLSKIEQGHAEPSPQIIALLLKRLGVDWLTNEQDLAESNALAGLLWEKALSYEKAAGQTLLHEKFSSAREKWLCGPQMLDFLILERFFDSLSEDTLAPFEQILSPDQAALRLALNGRPDEALLIQPKPLFFLLAGMDDYTHGQNTRAVERFTQAYALAAQEGRLQIMLEAKAFSGTCYSNLKQIGAMQEHYAVARRIASSLGEKVILREMDYNAACTELETGHVSEAYHYFSSLAKPSAMELHKLAICCEKLEKQDEALTAIHQAIQTPSDLSSGFVARLCAPVQYRLEHSDYLSQEEYGQMLLALFEDLKKTMPYGYARFHTEWVAEWYAAHRQYRALVQLYNDFPQGSL